MDKEEILARSRRERVDEGAKNAENHGMKIGIICFLAVLVFLMALTFSPGSKMMRWLLFFGRMSQQRPFPAIGLAKKNPCWSPLLRAGCLPSPILPPM